MEETPVVSKLEQANKLQQQIGEANKHKELINKILLNHADANALPPVSVKTNAQYSNFMVLTEKYLPIATNQFWTEYLGKVDTEMSTLQADLNKILS